MLIKGVFIAWVLAITFLAVMPHKEIMAKTNVTASGMEKHIVGMLTCSSTLAVETAPRISDREIVERLTRLGEGQKNLEERITSLGSGLSRGIDDLRMQWQMHRRQTRMETILETHKDELAFLKNLIDKLLPPKGVL